MSVHPEGVTTTFCALRSLVAPPTLVRPGLEAEPDRGLPKEQPSAAPGSESPPEVDETPRGWGPGKLGLT